jgi:small subunit ribosomal protein S1
MKKQTRESSRFERMRAKFGLDDAERQTEPAYEELNRAVEDLDYKYELNMIIPGKVVHFEPRGALVDVGAKTAAFLPLTEMAMERISSPEEVLRIGEEREFQIIATEDTEGQLRVSIKRIEYTRAWEQMQKALAEDTVVQAEVVAVNRGGASVRVRCLRGFLPASHIVLVANFIPGLPSDPRLEDLVGKELPVKLLEVDADKNRLVVSHRRALAEKSLMNVETGSVLEGTVRGIKPYGVFVESGGVSGLLHISQISHEHVEDLTTVFTMGDKVRALVVSQDREKGRVSLSTKALEPEPGDMLRSPDMVYERAEEMAERYRQRIAEEERARAEYASDIVAGLDVASLGVDADVNGKTELGSLREGAEEDGEKSRPASS